MGGRGFPGQCTSHHSQLFNCLQFSFQWTLYPICHLNIILSVQAVKLTWELTEIKTKNKFKIAMKRKIHFVNPIMYFEKIWLDRPAMNQGSKRKPSRELQIFLNRPWGDPCHCLINIWFDLGQSWNSQIC